MTTNELIDFSQFERVSDVPDEVWDQALTQSMSGRPSAADPSIWLDKRYFTRYGTLFVGQGRELNRSGENIGVRDDSTFDRSIEQYTSFDDYWRRALLDLANKSLFLSDRDYSSLPIDDLVVPVLYYGLDSLLKSIGPTSRGQLESYNVLGKRYELLVKYLRDIFDQLMSVINVMSKYISLSGELDSIGFLDVTKYVQRNRFLERELQRLANEVNALNASYAELMTSYGNAFRKELSMRRQVVRTLTSLLSGLIFKTGVTSRDVLPRTAVDDRVMSRMNDMIELYQDLRQLLDRKRIRELLMFRIQEHLGQYQRDMNGSTLLFPYF